jgi:transcriptional regulator with XRE-family HTH domain
MKSLMNRAGFRAGQVAKELGVQPQTVHAWFAGKRRVPPEMRQKMAEMFGVDQREFYAQEPAVRDEASRIIAEALQRIAGGESVEAAFLAAAEGKGQLAGSETGDVKDGAGKLLAYLNDEAGGDWKSLPPERRLAMVEKLLSGV